jgi:low temperature requirement protein LtrA
VIICLGESVVAIGVGVGTAEHRLSAELVLAAGLALLVGLLWVAESLADGGEHAEG